MGFRGGGSAQGLVPFAPPSAPVDVGQAEQTGTSPYVPHADHQHAVPAATGQSTTIAAATGDGVSTAPARADHAHAINPAAFAAGARYLLIDGTGTLRVSATGPAS